MSRLPRAVIVLGFVSFLTDISSEMIYPLLPTFLAGTLGATALELGIIEGVAETTASLLKIFSGLWTDRIKRRKPFVLLGYSLAGLARPLIGLASSWQMVLGFRFTDRVGKGIRTPPRDALIADVTEPAHRGRAYGFHRSMDHAGAVIGPLVAGALLLIPGFSLRNVFLLASIPAALGIVLIVLGVREKAVAVAASRSDVHAGLFRNWSKMGPSFRSLLLAYFVFTLGNSTDAFLLLRLSEAKVSTGLIALLWSIHHGVKMVSTYWGGIFSDRFSRRSLILAGWIYFALIYFAFARVSSPPLLITVFLAYGIFYGLSEPAERALVSDLVPTDLRGTAFGFFHFAVGLGALPASLIFGWVWKSHGAPAAFTMGAGFAILGALLLYFGVPGIQKTAPRTRRG